MMRAPLAPVPSPPPTLAPATPRAASPLRDPASPRSPCRAAAPPCLQRFSSRRLAPPERRRGSRRPEAVAGRAPPRLVLAPDAGRPRSVASARGRPDFPLISIPYFNSDSPPISRLPPQILRFPHSAQPASPPATERDGLTGRRRLGNGVPGCGGRGSREMQAVRRGGGGTTAAPRQRGRPAAGGRRPGDGCRGAVAWAAGRCRPSGDAAGAPRLRPDGAAGRPRAEGGRGEGMPGCGGCLPTPRGSCTSVATTRSAATATSSLRWTAAPPAAALLPHQHSHDPRTSISQSQAIELPQSCNTSR
ncbi:hypothetical protein BS78_05G018000 [Paspalum vaginatum]|nr:hypothetical protein BS78_05G018000 [Paspalum vaginatum]